MQNLDLGYSTDGRRDNSLSHVSPIGREASQQRGSESLHLLSNVAELHPNLHRRRSLSRHDALKIVQSVTKDMLRRDDKDSSPGSEIEVFRSINNLINKDEDNTVQGTGSSGDDSSGNSAGQFKCSHCPKRFKRRCEHKKHEMRHTRPWICTAVSCDKRFGTKSDWQRHEKSCNKRGREFIEPDSRERLHVCLEYDPKSHSRKCGFVHTSETYFKSHLKEAHHIVDEAALARLWRDYDMTADPGCGWCGFCLNIVSFGESPQRIGSNKNKDTGYGQYTARADHISEHVYREGRLMDSYVSLEYHLKKKDSKPDRLQAWFHAQRPGGHDPRIHNPGRAKNPKKRMRKTMDENSDEDGRRRKRMSTATWECVGQFHSSFLHVCRSRLTSLVQQCQCQNFYLIKQYDACLDCHHYRGSCCQERPGDCQEDEDAFISGSNPAVIASGRPSIAHASMRSATNIDLPQRPRSKIHAPPHDARRKYALVASSDEERIYDLSG